MAPQLERSPGAVTSVSEVLRPRRVPDINRRSVAGKLEPNGRRDLRLHPRIERKPEGVLQTRARVRHLVVPREGVAAKERRGIHLEGQGIGEFRHDAAVDHQRLSGHV